MQFDVIVPTILDRMVQTAAKVCCTFDACMLDRRRVPHDEAGGENSACPVCERGSHCQSAPTAPFLDSTKQRGIGRLRMWGNELVERDGVLKPSDLLDRAEPHPP